MAASKTTLQSTSTSWVRTTASEAHSQQSLVRAACHDRGAERHQELAILTLQAPPCRRRASSIAHRPVQLFVPAQPVAPAAAASRRRRCFVLVVRTRRPVADHSRPHSRKRLRGTSRRMGTHPTRTRTARPPCQDLAVSAERSIGRRRAEQTSDRGCYCYGLVIR